MRDALASGTFERVSAMRVMGRRVGGVRRT